VDFRSIGLSIKNSFGADSIDMKGRSSTMTVYEIITNKFIESLEQGIIPWRKPWNVNGMSYNHTTKKPYRYINQMLLAGGEYLTFQQVTAEGGKVKKGEKGNIVISYFEQFDKDEDGNDIPESKRVLPRYYYVFEVSQCEGIKRNIPIDREDHEPIKEAQDIVDNYFDREACVLSHTMGNKACYRPSSDEVIMPNMSLFKSATAYYGVLFHEMTHSTMHKDRCNRTEERFGKNVAFGSKEYSKEELVAEIGSSFILARIGLDSNEVFTNSKAYIQSWIAKLKNEPKWIIEASGKAEKATEYILGE